MLAFLSDNYIFGFPLSPAFGATCTNYGNKSFRTHPTEPISPLITYIFEATTKIESVLLEIALSTQCMFLGSTDPQ